MRRNPFEELEELLENMGQQFERSPTPGGLQSFQSVAVDVREHDDEFVVTADLPGFETDDVDLTLSENTLSIGAEREESEAEREDDGSYIRRERRRESVSRSVRLPEDVDETAVSAAYENGVLTVTLPKAHGADEGHRIDIE